MSIMFTLGSVNFYTYGIFLVLGVLCGGYHLYFQAKKQGKNTDMVFDLIIFPVLAGIIASRLSYYFIYLSQSSPMTEAFRIWDGGMVSWGGFVVAVIVLLIILKRYRQDPLYWLDIYSISAILGLAIGRMGSFISGEYAGLASGSSFAINGVYPVTLYESIILFVLFFVFVLLYAKRLFKHNGYYFLSVLIWYSLIRFIMDFLRVDPKYFAGLSLTQIVSAFIILVVIAIFFYKILLRKGVKSAK